MCEYSRQVFLGKVQYGQMKINMKEESQLSTSAHQEKQHMLNPILVWDLRTNDMETGIVPKMVIMREYSHIER